MRVAVETLLSRSPERAWNEVLTPRLLSEVASPLATIHPLRGEEFPERWVANQTVRCRCYLFGLIPIGTRTIYFERIDPEAWEIQSRESDPLVKRWDHLVKITDAGGGRCRYADVVEIEAGVLTLVVWLFAMGFYRHRQRCWRAVARCLTASGAA